MHAEAPFAAEYVPGLHGEQALLCWHPMPKYVPSSQSVHAAAACAELHEPGAQQVHALALVAPAGPYLPGPQLVQVGDATASEYFPAEHVGAVRTVAAAGKGFVRR